MMKYIRFRNLGNEEDIIFTFPIDLQHAEFSQAITDKYNYAEPISAGFVADDGVCSGESITLKLKARIKEDTELLENQLL